MIDNEILRSDEWECEKVFSELYAYFDGELDEKSASRVKEHLEKCEKCRRLLSELYDLSEDIAASSVPYPDDLHSRLMGALDVEMSKGRKRSKALDFGKAMKKHGMWMGAGIAAAICLVLVGSPLFRGSLEFAKSDSKSIEMEDAIVLPTGGIEAAYEMSRYSAEEDIYYAADEPECMAEGIKAFSNTALSDTAEKPDADGADDMDMTGSAAETESEEKNSAFGKDKYSLLPTFMIPRDELGERKTEFFH